MYDYQINELVSKIKDSLVLDDKAAGLLKVCIEEYFDDKGVITWDVEDVMMVACENDIEIKDKKIANAIARYIPEIHDAERGVGWDDVYWLIKDFMEKHPGSFERIE